MARVSKPGIYTDIRPLEYHADPVSGRSVTRSELERFLDVSPYHARTMREEPPAGSRAMEIGTVAHAVVTGHYSTVEIIAEDSWNARAKRQATAARKLGKTPVLQAVHDTAIEAVDRLNAGIDELEDPELNVIFRHEPKFGTAEVVVVWEENGVMCRCMIDWLSADASLIVDYKTTKGPLTDRFIERQIIDGLDMQAAYYPRGVEAVTGRPAKFLFVWQEMQPPYDFAIVAPSYTFQVVGNKKIDLALSRWADCVHEDRWPGYDKSGKVIEAPAWYEAKWLAEEVEEADRRAARKFSPGETLLAG